MLASPRAAIGDAPDGTAVRLVGEVVALDGAIREAPVSGTPCVYFEAVLEQAGADAWRLVARETGGVPFVLRDATGDALIDPAHARVSLGPVNAAGAGTFDDPSDRERAFLARHGQPARLLLADRSFRCREGVVEVGTQVAVVGVAVREPDPDVSHARGYREAAVRIRLSGTAARPLAIDLA
jgi:hypothetical protein